MLDMHYEYTSQFAAKSLLIGWGESTPILLTAADSMNKAQTMTARTTEAGGPVCKEVLEVAMLIYSPAPLSKLPLSDR